MAPSSASMVHHDAVPSPPAGEEHPQQLRRLLGEQPARDGRAMVEPRLASTSSTLPAAPALGSAAPKITRGTRAEHHRPAHIAHGSRVT